MHAEKEMSLLAENNAAAAAGRSCGAKRKHNLLNAMRHVRYTGGFGACV